RSASRGALARRESAFLKCDPNATAGRTAFAFISACNVALPMEIESEDRFAATATPASGVRGHACVDLGAVAEWPGRRARGSRPSSRDSTGLVTQSDRPRPELLAAHELQLEPLAQTGEQRRPVARQDGLHDELVLVDQPQIRQGQRERHASHVQTFAWLLLELLNRLPQVPLHELCVPIDP